MSYETETDERMNILFVSPTLPYPAIDGGRIRVLNLVSRLCRIHKVTFLTFVATSVDEQNIAYLREMGMKVIGVKTPNFGGQKQVSGILRSLLQTLFYGKPLTVAKYSSSDMIKALRDLLREHQFNIAHFEMLHTGQFLSDAKLKDEDICLTVLGEQNIDSNVWYRLAKAESNPLKKFIFYLQYRKFAGYESRICPEFDMCICVSEQDQDKLMSICPGITSGVVSNGVDLNYFRAGQTRQDIVSLVFTGSMDWQPNEDAVLYFCNHIFPIIKAELPVAIFYIVGSKPSEKVLKLGNLEGVVVTGLVEDVRPYISDASVYVVPLRIGGGTRLKILQALAMKKAVVSTSIGCEGLNIQSGKHLFVADEPEQFAADVIRLAKDSEFSNKLGNNGNALVQEQYSWDAIVKRLDTIYRNLAKNMMSV